MVALIKSLFINFAFWIADTIGMLAEIFNIIFRGVRYE